MYTQNLGYNLILLLFIQVVDSRDCSLFMGGGMGEKMGGPEILATAKGGVLGKFFCYGGGS